MEGILPADQDTISEADCPKSEGDNDDGRDHYKYPFDEVLEVIVEERSNPNNEGKKAQDRNDGEHRDNRREGQHISFVV